MKNKNGLSYENIVNNLENDKIYVPETREYQALSKEKTKEFVLKCISGALIIVGIGTTAMGCAKKKTKNEQTTTAIVAEGEEPESLKFEYVLYDPTDMDIKEERIEYINEVNDNNKNNEHINVKLTDRMVKYYNGTLTKEDFGNMSDEEILKEFQSYNLNAVKILQASVKNLDNIKNDRKYSYEENEKLIAGFFDSDSKSKKSIFGDGVFGKKYFNQYVAIINEQAKDIINNTNGDYTGNASVWYDFCMKVLNDDEVPVNEKYLFSKMMICHEELFDTELTKKQHEYLEKTDFEGTYGNLVHNKYVEAFGIKNVKTGEDCGDKTKKGEKYESKDEKDAQSHAGLTGEEGKKTTKKGGKKEGTTSVVISGSQSTGSTQSTTVVNKEKETTKKETKPGGKVVDEQTTNKPPKVIDEEVVEPGKDNVESGTYTEEEWNSKSSSKTETTTKKETTTKQEENSSSDDREFEEILTEDEWLRYLGMGSIGLGGFVGVTPKIKRRKK